MQPLYTLCDVWVGDRPPGMPTSGSLSSMLQGTFINVNAHCHCALIVHECSLVLSVGIHEDVGLMYCSSTVLPFPSQ